MVPPNTELVVASFHPAFAMHGLPQLRGSIAAVIARARTWAQRDHLPNRNFKFHPNPQPDVLATALTKASKFVVDVETPRDDDSTILLCGAATAPDEAYVCAWMEPYISILADALQDKKKLRIGHNISFDAKAFRRYGINLEWPVVDTIQAAALLWPSPPRSKQDEKAGKQASRISMLSLAACSLRVLDDIAYWKEVDRDARVRAYYRAAWPGVPEALYPYLYCANDCVNNFRLWPVLREFLSREGLLELFVNTVAPAGHVLHKIEARGMLLDVGRRDKLREECAATIESNEKDIKYALGDLQERRLARIRDETTKRHETKTRLIFDAPGGCFKHSEYKGLTKRAKCEGCAGVYAAAGDFRAQVEKVSSDIRKLKATEKRVTTAYEKLSDDYWRWVLFDKRALGLKPVSYTEKRRDPQVDDDTMEELQRRNPDNPLLKLKVGLKRAQNELRMRLGVEPEHDGRVHFVISMHRAGTGRFASGSDDVDVDKIRQSPGNIQNLTNKARRMYIAPEGRWLVAADWSQIEARVVAWRAYETKMLEAFALGKDIHSLNAQAIYGCDYDKAREMQVYFQGEMREAREAAKHGTHGLNYYMLIQGLMYTFGLDLATATALFTGYHRAWPKIKPWQLGQIRYAAENGYLRNYFGRKDWFYGRSKDQKTGEWVLKEPGRAVAFAPQSDVADMAKRLMKRLDSLDVELLTNTHDSFLAEADICDAENVAKLMKKEMECTWAEFGTRTILGKETPFWCPTDVAVGKNWGKFHEHKPTCHRPCPKEENLDGVKEIRFV